MSIGDTITATRQNPPKKMYTLSKAVNAGLSQQGWEALSAEVHFTKYGDPYYKNHKHYAGGNVFNISRGAYNDISTSWNNERDMNNPMAGRLSLGNPVSNLAQDISDSISKTVSDGKSYLADIIKNNPIARAVFGNSEES